MSPAHACSGPSTDPDIRCHPHAHRSLAAGPVPPPSPAHAPLPLQGQQSCVILRCGCLASAIRDAGRIQSVPWHDADRSEARPGSLHAPDKSQCLGVILHQSSCNGQAAQCSGPHAMPRQQLMRQVSVSDFWLLHMHVEACTCYQVGCMPYRCQMQALTSKGCRRDCQASRGHCQGAAGPCQCALSALPGIVQTIWTARSCSHLGAVPSR